MIGRARSVSSGGDGGGGSDDSDSGPGGVDRGSPGTPNGGGDGVPPPGGSPRQLGVSLAAPRRRQAQPYPPSVAASSGGRGAAARRSRTEGDGGERRRYLAQLRLLRLPASDQLVLADLACRLPCVAMGLTDVLNWAAVGMAAPAGSKGGVARWRCPQGVSVEVRSSGCTAATAVSADPRTSTDSKGTNAADHDSLFPSRGGTAPSLPPTALASSLAAALDRQYTAAQLCIAARDRLVVANLLLVERVVAQVVSRYGATPDAAGGGVVPPADLAQEGALALVRATASFDPNRGVPFVHYAGLVVRAGVVRSMENHGRLVRLPVLLLQRILRIQRKYREVEMALAAGGMELMDGGTDMADGASPMERMAGGGELSLTTAAAVTASVMGIPQSEVERLAVLAQAGTSLDASFSSGGGCGGWGGGWDGGGGGGGDGGAPSFGSGADGGCLLDGLESQAPLPEQAVADAEAACTVRAVIERLLDADERAVMTRLYGLCLGGDGAAGEPTASDPATSMGGRGSSSGSNSRCCYCSCSRCRASDSDSDGDAADTRAPSAAAQAAMAAPLGCVKVQTKAEIGRNFGWSRSHVRTVERRALSKMRHSELRGYRNMY
ncbi:hypothetical protein MMPV_004117 [Pyropia vietnamensis]